MDFCERAFAAFVVLLEVIISLIWTLTLFWIFTGYCIWVIQPVRKKRMCNWFYFVNEVFIIVWFSLRHKTSHWETMKIIWMLTIALLNSCRSGICLYSIVAVFFVHVWIYLASLSSTSVFNFSGGVSYMCCLHQGVRHGDTICKACLCLLAFDKLL